MQILVTGASGRLGAHLLQKLADLGHEVVAWSGSTGGERSGIAFRKVELGDPQAVLSAIEEASPDVVIHAGAISRADAVRRQPAKGWNVNVCSTELLCAWAGKHDRRLLFTSTDLVFDGAKSWYREGDPAAPILEYGRTKLAAEAAVLAACRGLVVRLSLLYGPSRTDGHSYFDQAIAALRGGRPQTFFEDEFRTPLDYGTAAEILVGLAESDATGIIHAGGPQRLSRFELMQRAAAALGADRELVRANRLLDVPAEEPRPVDVSLESSLLRTVLPGLVLPAIEEALASSGGRGPTGSHLPH
jgi:dTDP-4-dehydrorhamnose reductase